MRRRKPRPLNPRPATHLRPDELAALVAAVRNGGSLRDCAIVLLFLACGLRNNELAMLDRADMDWGAGRLTIRHGKGGKIAELPVHRVARAALRAYLDRRDDDNPAMFLSQRRTRLTTRGLRVVLDRYTGPLDLGKRIRVHSLRHTYGTAVWRQTGDLELTRRAMRHSSVATTQRYMHLEDSELDAALAGLTLPGAN